MMDLFTALCSIVVFGAAQTQGIFIFDHYIGAFRKSLVKCIWTVSKLLSLWFDLNAKLFGTKEMITCKIKYK